MKEFVSISKQKLHLHKLCKQSFKIDKNFKFFGTMFVVYNWLLKYVFLLMGFIHLDDYRLKNVHMYKRIKMCR